MKSKNYFVTAKKCNKLGIRIRLTYTFAANGNTAALYVVISGLKESQMPSSFYPTGCHVEEIPGLSTAAAIDPSVSSTSPGYIVFVRSGKNIIEDESSEQPSDNMNEDDEIDLGTGMQNSVKFYRNIFE